MAAAPAFIRIDIDGARLRAARWDAGLSQAVVSQRAGVSLRTVVLAERGIASRKSIEKIAACLRIDPAALVVDTTAELPTPAHT
jgi:predicted transcriptional regulator